MNVADLNEIAAGKLVALVGRRASRDLYDAWRLLERDDLDWPKVKAATLAIGASQRDLDWREASLDGHVFDPREMQSKLIAVVKKDTFAEHGSPQGWCERMLEGCRDRSRPLFQFDEGDGRIDTSGLKVDEEVKRRIEAFPALRWKAQHVAGHIAAADGPMRRGPLKRARRSPWVLRLIQQPRQSLSAPPSPCS